ncbi:Uncharacterised protein [Mycolicibacterium gilvum]|uniref:Uncharacterized protein n=1 Tax=Mycolicibacterium gilvum TaxID=1804 RepID=A0A378SMI2_9MYCO|nr:hypothetical protein [Mycolicibacterium gilvum]MCV7058969.1 hypothetical protein [Mycolicibacterium gilvum]STZ44012.1 Uncharacterised protein [Mycolicibacterium gilvum]
MLPAYPGGQSTDTVAIDATDVSPRADDHCAAQSMCFMITAGWLWSCRLGR